MRIGQRLMDLAPHVDYVCPMVYPSTFQSGNLDLASPSDNPYEVIARSMASGMSRTDTLLRPWLQGYWYERQDFADQKTRRRRGHRRRMVFLERARHL